ncbi:MAG TPA: HutD family protein [Dyella sp.]|uniref:HutD/Ves family protein n=1 Tax=Dyella sp. TaxID=1869338 RepID=UPI002F95FE56
MSAIRRIGTGALQEQPWANGMGSTLLIDSAPACGDWQWRLSIARIERDSPFSLLPAVRRQFVALDAPIRLVFEHGHQQDLLRLQPFAFNGGEPVRAELSEGATRAFNLMLRGQAQGQLLARPLNGTMLLPIRPDSHWYVHLLAGWARLHVDDEVQELHVGDHAWIEVTAPARAQIEGGGEVILVQLDVQRHR